MQDEILVWSGRPSQILNMGTYIICGLLSLTIVLLPITAPIAIWKYLVVRNRKYELTSQRLICHSGVLSKKANELELYRVKDIQFDQPFFLRIFSLANIMIFSADETSPLIKLEA